MMMMMMMMMMGVTVVMIVPTRTNRCEEYKKNMGERERQGGGDPAVVGVPSTHESTP